MGRIGSLTCAALAGALLLAVGSAGEAAAASAGPGAVAGHDARGMVSAALAGPDARSVVSAATIPAAAMDPGPAPLCAYPGTGSPSMQAMIDGIVNHVTVGGVKPMCRLGGSLPVPAQCQSYVNGPGRTSLLRSLATFDGCMGFAWSTGLDLSAASPQLTYLPLGDDALAYAVLPNGVLPRTLGQADLKAIYTCDPAYVGTGPAYQVTPVLPGPGSLVRTRWEALMGITDADLAAGRYPCVHDSLGGTAVADNDGRVLTPSSLVPFSVAAYLAQSTGQAPDQHGSSVLGSFDGSMPTGVDPSLPTVGFAVLANGDIPHELSTTDLKGIYTCDPAYVGQAPNYSLTGLLPARGSALRTAWENLVGISDADVVAGRYPCLSDHTPDGRAIPDDDGRVLGPLNIVPFDTTAYYAQVTGSAPDVHGNATLGMIDQNPPLLMSDSGVAKSQTWLVVPTGQLSTSLGASLFVGGSSLVCQQTSSIKLNGFGVDPGCGDTSLHTP
jgi:hypothetical protein